MRIAFELSFVGNDADNGMLDFYDGARALAGFQRTLALTTHLIVNGEIITQAPALQGAQILFPTPEQGSWKSRAVVILGGAFALGSVGKDSPVGHIVTSAYDYVLSETMGFHPDYDKTLQHQYKEHLEEKKITEGKIDSLIEKIEPSVADMHRPIIISKTATTGFVYGNGGASKIGPDLNPLTYDYVRQAIVSDEETEIVGYVSSYNLNTFKGRLFCITESRPIPFVLGNAAQTRSVVGVLTRSQHLNGQTPFDNRALVKIKAQRVVSVTGRLKRLIVHAAEAVQ